MLINLIKYGVDAYSTNSEYVIQINKQFQFTFDNRYIYTNLPCSRQDRTLHFELPSEPTQRKILLQLLDLASTYTEQELQALHPELLI